MKLYKVITYFQILLRLHSYNKYCPLTIHFVDWMRPSLPPLDENNISSLAFKLKAFSIFQAPNLN